MMVVMMVVMVMVAVTLLDDYRLVGDFLVWETLIVSAQSREGVAYGIKQIAIGQGRVVSIWRRRRCSPAHDTHSRDCTKKTRDFSVHRFDPC